ncbi:MAG: DegT/DnrJ/EryC1/StrS family aminotransferase [Armatimonadetes bacterium]|nr:DegT/DnrJ/EryC1/StrS family aminotransferase [Armatimonadota bacterium]
METKTRIPYRVMSPDEEMKQKAVAVLETGKSYGGEETERFETEVANWCGRRYGISTNSGTSVNMIALDAKGIGPGDEVILPANSYVGVLAAVVKVGATPVFVDVEPDTANADPKAVAAAIGPKTRAIIPTHFYGFPADMDPMIEAAKPRGVFVLEDACHALGAEYKGKPAGGVADAGFFSFSGKMITVFGPGGVLVTDDRDFAHDLSSLRDQGRNRAESISFIRRTDGAWYDQKWIGYNLHLTEICAAVGRLQLKQLPAYIAHRRRAAAYLTQRFRDAKLPVQLPPEKPYAKPCYLHYVLWTPQRDALKAHLYEAGIESSIHYPKSVHLLPPVMEQYGTKRGQFPVAEKTSDENLSLPVGPHMTEDRLETLANSVISFFQKNPS